MIQFYETRMGKKFFENDFPKMVKELSRIADALEKINDSESSNSSVLPDEKKKENLKKVMERFAEMQIFNGHDLSIRSWEMYYNETGLHFTLVDTQLGDESKFVAFYKGLKPTIMTKDGKEVLYEDEDGLSKEQIDYIIYGRGF